MFKSGNNNYKKMHGGGEYFLQKRAYCGNMPLNVKHVDDAEPED